MARQRRGSNRLLRLPLLEKIRDEARLEGQATLLVHLLQHRFGWVEPAIVSSLASIKQEAALLRLAVEAASCTDLEAFAIALNAELPAATIEERCLEGTRGGCAEVRRDFPIRTGVWRMTEPEWWKSAQLADMTELVATKKLSRKLRLFGCALCRRFPQFLRAGPILNAVETAERFADKHTGRSELAAARAAIRVQSPGQSAAGWVSNAAHFVAAASPRNAGFWAYSTTEMAARLLGSQDGEYAKLAAGLLRHIVGDPFRPAIPDRVLLSWNNGTIPALARAAYEERELPSGLMNPVNLSVLADALADALEDAGCPQQEWIEHLREPIGHPRGCWVVDALLKQKK